MVELTSEGSTLMPSILHVPSHSPVLGLADVWSPDVLRAFFYFEAVEPKLICISGLLFQPNRVLSWSLRANMSMVSSSGSGEGAFAKKGSWIRRPLME